MALKRYRAIGTGLVSHPSKQAAFVGYERVIDGSKADLEIPGGHRYRKLPEGEVLQDSADLRNHARQGALEELRLEESDP